MNPLLNQSKPRFLGLLYLGARVSFSQEHQKPTRKHQKPRATPSIVWIQPPPESVIPPIGFFVYQPTTKCAWLIDHLFGPESWGMLGKMIPTHSNLVTEMAKDGVFEVPPLNRMEPPRSESASDGVRPTAPGSSGASSRTTSSGSVLSALGDSPERVWLIPGTQSGLWWP